MGISFSPQLLHQQEQEGSNKNNMTNILIFLTAIAFVAHSFQKHMIQILHQLYKQYIIYAKEAEQHGEDDESSDSYCSVCLSQICKGDNVRTLPICNHRYHSDCIGAWLKNHTTCPLCRNKIIDHISNNNQHKLLHLKQFKESMIGVLLGFSDLLVGVVYMMLPSTIRETFPLVH